MVKIAAIVLAAGASHRHQQGDKLVREYRYAPLVVHALDGVAACDFSKRLCVTRASDNAVSGFARMRGFQIVKNEEADNGMGTSIAAGVRAVGTDVDATVIFLGDMPYILPSTISDLIVAFRLSVGSILRPTFLEKPGHPVFFSKQYFPALAALDNDDGAKAVIGACLAPTLIPVDDPGVIRDLDHDDEFVAANN